MKLVFQGRDGTEESLDADSGRILFRVPGEPEERAVYLSNLVSIEISGHPEYVPEKPLPTEPVEQSAADFFMGPVNAHFGTPEAQARKTTLTIRKGTK